MNLVSNRIIQNQKAVPNKFLGQPFDRLGNLIDT